MLESEFESLIKELSARDKRYHKEAYYFIRDALGYAQSVVHNDEEDKTKHVSAEQLMDGIRDHALKVYGPMTHFVLKEWGIHQTEDFGELVFNLIEIGLFRKDENDSKSDFRNGYEFFEAFEKPFLPSSKSVNEPSRS